jgi:hypothetical protein
METGKPAARFFHLNHRKALPDTAGFTLRALGLAARELAQSLEDLQSRITSPRDQHVSPLRRPGDAENASIGRTSAGSR